MPVQTNQIVNEAALVSLGQAARAQVDNILAALNKNSTAPLRIRASGTPDAFLNFEPSQTSAGDNGGQSIPAISGSVPTVAASTINFQTGATTGATFNGSFPSTTVGEFRRVGFTLLADGTIDMTFSAAAGSVGALANGGTLFTTGGLAIGWVDLEATASTAFKTAGSSTNVIENSVSGTARIVRIAAGGGAGGGGGSSTPSTTATINDNIGSLTTLVTVSAPNNSGEILYSIVRGTNRESGRVIWSHNGTTLSRTFYGDSGVGDTGVTLDVVLSGSNVLLQYTSTSTGSGGTLKYATTAWS